MRIEEATMDLTSMAMDQNQSMFKDDDKLRVQFTLTPHFNQDETNKQGRPIYDDTVYVTIMVPGQVDIIHRKAWKQDLERFPRQYAAFKNNQDQDAASGTPLKLLTWMSASQVKELEFFNVRTVEQLAAMPDSASAKFMGIQQLKQRAKDYLAEAAKQQPLVQMRTELEERDNRIEVLERQIKELAKKLEEVSEDA